MSEEEQIALLASDGMLVKRRCWWQMVSSCLASSPLSGKRLFCDL